MTDVPVTTGNGALPALSDEDLALMAGDSGTNPQFKRDQLMTPRLLLLQSTSEQTKRGEPGYIDNAREGDFIDTLTLQLRAELALVICHFEISYTEWKPNQGPLVKLWGTDSSRYDSAQGDFGDRTTEEGHVIRPSFTYYGLLMTDEQGGSLPVVFDLARTQTGAARRLNSLMATLEFKGPNGPFNPPLYARTYHAGTQRQSNEQGSWMVWKFTPGPLTLALPGYGRALYEKAKALKESIARGEVRPTPERHETAEAAPESASEERPPARNRKAKAVADDDIPF